LQSAPVPDSHGTLFAIQFLHLTITKPTSASLADQSPVKPFQPVQLRQIVS
jgi:hypothetical protein